MTRQLFRDEVLGRRSDGLYSDVHIAVPVTWHVIGITLLAFTLAAIIFLSTGSYAHFENVSGVIVPDTGIVSIVPTRPGIITELRVKEGQRVKRGTALVEVRAEESMGGGITGPRRAIEALAKEDSTLGEQSAKTLVAADAERARLGQQAAGLALEVRGIEDQMSDQRRLVQVADADFNMVKDVAERGFVSQRDLRSREEALLLRRQQLSQLTQSRDAKMSQLVEARRAITQAVALARAQVAGLASSRAGVAQRLADVEAVRGYTLISPISGIATAITAHVGQAVSSENPLMTLIPKGGHLRAELYVPTKAAGFITVGQSVRLAIDAFPYQRFGTIQARVVAVSSATTNHRDANGNLVPVYLLTAEISQQWLAAFGRRQALLPGMLLSARIITEKQSLIRWLLQPLFSVSKR